MLCVCIYIHTSIRSVYARNSRCYGANVWFIFPQHPFTFLSFLPFCFLFSFFRDYFILYLLFLYAQLLVHELGWRVCRGRIVQRIFIASFFLSLFLFIRFIFSCCYSLEGTLDILSNDCLIQTLSPPFTVLFHSSFPCSRFPIEPSASNYGQAIFY